MESSEAGQGVGTGDELQAAMDAATSTYVVQEKAADDVVGGVEMGAPVWIDIATVAVPQKTKRKTVIDAALKSTGLDPDDVGPLRVLDEDSAAPWGQKPVVRDPVTTWVQEGSEDE